MSKNGRVFEISIDEIQDRLERYAQREVASIPKTVEEESPYSGLVRKAAVLIPLARVMDEWHLILTRRTETVQDHKGQVAFPGGGWEPKDTSLQETALRETWEEIGLLPTEVRVLGRLPAMHTVSAYFVTPFVGMVPWPFEPVLSPDEVSHLFTIPLAWLCNPENFEEKLYQHPRTGEMHPVIFYHPYAGEVLWGISGRITIEFLKILDLID
jgi:8-oxo-dGTP pyrophosphatase MutT (NUDIX family)